MSKILVIGWGNVAITYVYSLVCKKIEIDDIVIIHHNENKDFDADIEDISHCLINKQTRIRNGKYLECEDADIACIAAGIHNDENMIREEFLKKSSEMIKEIIENLTRHLFKGICLIISNPLDVMTTLSYLYSGFPSNRVIGTGTSLDTNRLIYYISKRLNVSKQEIHCNVLGEHGFNQFVNWDEVFVSKKPITNLLTKEELNDIFECARDISYKIVKEKGYTNYGISYCAADITESIINNNNKLINVSTYDSELEVAVSKPCIINCRGAFAVDVDKTFYINSVININNEKNYVLKDAKIGGLTWTKKYFAK